MLIFFKHCPATGMHIGEEAIFRPVKVFISENALESHGIFCFIKFRILIHLNIVQPLVCKTVTRLRGISVQPVMIS